MLFQKTNVETLNYLPPILREGKEWYIEFYVKHPHSGKLRRKRIKLNRIKKITDRRRIGRAICAELSAKLICGWNPFLEETAPKSYTTLQEAIDCFIKIKKKNTEPTTMVGYLSFIKMLYDWIDSKGYKRDMYVVSFTWQLASEYMLSIESSAVSYRTYGNRLRFYKTLFYWLVENHFIAENPFEKIKFHKKRVAVKKRRRLTSQEKSSLLNYLYENERYEYLCMCLICYYCMIRDKEICLLKVGDINLKHQTIKVSDSIAKNNHTSHRTIPDAIIPYLLKLRLDAPSDYYLFSDCPKYGFYPGKKQATSRKVYNFWEYYVRKALGWGKDLCFYSLKDTGITDLTSSGVPLNFVQGQADHSNVAITSLYLESMTPEAHESLKKVNTFNAE